MSVWGELRGERKAPGVLRVLVAGQHAGAIQRDGNRWEAQAGGPRPSRPTSHASAEEALQAVVRSAWARRLGARAASRVIWTDRARRTIARDGAR